MKKIINLYNKLRSIGISQFFFWLLTLTIINSTLFFAFSFSPETVFKNYTLGYFKSITSWLHVFYGIIPFSIGDIFYLLIFALFSYLFFLFNINLFKKKFKHAVHVASRMLALLMLLYFILNTQWNWNYLQSPLEDKLEIETFNYSDESLIKFTEKVIANAIKYREESNFNVFDHDPYSIIDISIIGYEELKRDDLFFKIRQNSIKYSLFSSILPYFGISGYYNPFTAEAQLTKGVPIKQIPFIVNHEVAHQLGIASESEANFMGYLASINNPLSTIKYSGYLNLLMYCLSDIRKMNPQEYQKIKEKLPVGINEDLQEIYDYWKSYQNKFRAASDFAYDLFLKSNGQHDGMKSYNRVVSLALAYDKKELQ